MDFLLRARWLRDRRLGELLLWCLPALLVALAFRTLLMAQLPLAIYHPDTPDFLTTTENLLQHGKLSLHSKKTFLSPVVFTAPFLLGLPALTTLALFQHALGLGAVVIAGTLCRLWLQHWKWLIVPVTLLVAANPAMLWFEHTLMAESLFVFCTLLLALAATLYARKQTRGTFVLLAVALFLEAGARPEGKLFFAFAILMAALIHWGQWRRCAAVVGILTLLAGVTHLATRTTQSGLLLYTAVAHLTPDRLYALPGFAERVAPIRDGLRAGWEVRPTFPRAVTRKAISAEARAWLEEHGRRGDTKSSHKVCARAAMETCLRRWYQLPALFFYKFRYVSALNPAGTFDALWLPGQQIKAYELEPARALYLSRGLFGKEMASMEKIEAQVSERFHPARVAWMDRWERAWFRAGSAWRMPDARYADGRQDTGIPLYQIAALAGVVALMVRADRLWRFHVSWGLVLLGLTFVVVVTASAKARFTFYLEPFWPVYVAALMDSLVVFGARLRRGA